MISPAVLEKLEFNKVLQNIIRYAATEGGRSSLQNVVPFVKYADSEKEGRYVTEAKEILIRNDSPPMEGLPYMEESLFKSRIDGAVLDAKKILEVYHLAVMSRMLFQYMKNNKDAAPNLFGLGKDLIVDKLFEHNIRKVIGESGEIPDNASAKLREIRSEIRSKKEDLVRSVNRIMKSLEDKDIVREDYLTLRDGRMVIPVKAEHKRHLRGFIHSESSTGQTVYIEPEETLELNNDIVTLSFAEKREIERLLKELTKLIGGLSERLLSSLKAVSHLDNVFARAKFSVEINGSYPEVSSDKPFLLKDARHPLLLKKFGRSETVPLDLEISDDRVVVITGPNAGGKTVVLKTIGLLVLMVQSGIHIPANPDSNFRFFDNVLLDIGDQQSIEDDLSTFSSHLSNINNIMKTAGVNSLVLLDEIGTGTDPAEGSALAAAVLVSLRDLEATVFATTHHGSLKLIANDMKGFENAAMEFDNEGLKPTYKFKQGIPGSSYAFEIAKRIGLDDKFLSIAESYLDSDKHKIETFLVEVETKAQQLEAKLKKLELENIRLSGLSNLYKKNIDKLNTEKKEILKKAKKEAEDYIKGINSRVEKVIKELKESKADSSVIKESKKIINSIKEKNKIIAPIEVDTEFEKHDFKVGERAAIKNTETAGEIIELSIDKGRAVLRVGALKIQTRINELVPAKDKKERSSPAAFSHNVSMTAADYRIDIRGERVEEAEFEVIRFIDNAYTTGLERIEILHGKGTGALKKMVKDILKKHERVKNFYFAPLELGGDGITIAELN